MDTLRGVGVKAGTLWLGGGAALAARWRHRQEDSVALFARWEDLPQDLRQTLSMRIMESLPGELRPGMAGNLTWARWETGHGKAAIFARSPWLGPWLSEETEERHGLPLERAPSILGAKILGRMLNCGQILTRDLHDLAACAVLDPEGLAPLGSLFGITALPALAPEILFSERTAPRAADEGGEAESLLRKASARLFSQGIEAFVRRARSLGQEWLDRIPQRPRGHPDPIHGPSVRPVPLAPLEAFSRCPPFREPQPFRPDGFMPGIRKNMAGVAMRPSPGELRDWIRAGPGEALPKGAMAFIRESLSRMTGIEAIRFRQGCGASLLEIARTAHRTGIEGAVFPSWLNRHARLCAGDRREEIEGYESLGPLGRSPG